jgi:hypothetical protein
LPSALEETSRMKFLIESKKSAIEYASLALDIAKVAGEGVGVRNTPHWNAVIEAQQRVREIDLEI